MAFHLYLSSQAETTLKTRLFSSLKMVTAEVDAFDSFYLVLGNSFFQGCQ